MEDKDTAKIKQNFLTKLRKDLKMWLRLILKILNIKPHCKAFP